MKLGFKIPRWQILTLILILFLTVFLIYLDKSYKAGVYTTLFPAAPAIGNFAQSNFQDPTTAECASEVRPAVVRGSSLSGLIENGENLKILVGYYSCHPIEREDIVVYNYAGNEAPLIKIIKGLAGDRFQLKKSATGCGWNILVNGSVVKNSQTIPYCLNERGYRTLSLYGKDDIGIIPQNVYLILGNLPLGSLDSTRFGLIGRQDLIGKVTR